MVAVIGAVLVYLWFAGYVTKATSHAELMTASEKLKIEAASLTTGTPPQAQLYIRNLGGVDVQVVQAYIYRSGSSNVLCADPLYASPIEPGDVLHITPALPSCLGRIYAGYDYVIKVVTQKGTEVAVTVTAS